MADFRYPNNKAMGYANSVQSLASQPIVAARAPSSTDKADLGQIFVDTTTGTGYICVDISAGVTTWANAAGSTFAATDITVNPGPSSFTGLFSVNGNTGADPEISLVTNGAATETIQITNTVGTSTDAISIRALQGGLDLISNVAGADSVLVEAAGAAGGVTIDAGTGGITLTTSGAITMNPGTATALVVAVGDLDLEATTGSVVVTGGEAVADAIQLTASDVAGGIDINAGTGGITVDTTGALSLDSAGATNLTATGAFDITVQSTAGSILINAGEAVADAINIDSTGGFDLDSALQVNIASSQNSGTAISLNASAGAMEMQAQGAAGEDIVIRNIAGSINLNAGEAAADAINIDSTGGFDLDTALQVNIASSQNSGTAISLNASAGGIELQAAGAAGEDIVLNNVAGSINLTPGEAAANALRINTAGGIDSDSTLGVNFTDAGGAGVDFVIQSTAGSINLIAGEAAADAVNIDSTGGFDLDTALQINLASSQNSATAISLNASAGGIELQAAGAAGEDIVLNNAAGSINLVAAEAAANALRFNASAGGIDSDSVLGVNITDAGGAGVDISVISTAGSINLNAGEAAADAINIDSTGGFDLDTALQVNIASSQNAATAVSINASAGGIELQAAGAAGEDIVLNNAAGSINLVAAESIANALRFQASGVAGGMDLDAGTGGFIVDTTGAISLDSAAASNFTVTGAFDLTLDSSAGSVNVTGAEAATDAVKISASNAAGGITLDFGAQIGCILTDGTSTARLMVYSTDPNGVITAPKGSLCIDVGTPNLWVNNAGGNAWTAH